MSAFFGRWWVRLPVLFVILLALYIGAASLFRPLIGALHGVPPGVVGVAFSIIAALIGVYVYRGLVWRMETRRADELSRNSLGSGLLVGTLVGFAMFGAVIAILAAM